MFENDVAGLDEDATLAAVEGNEHTAVEVEVTRLLLAAHWADLKPGDAVDPHGLPGAERAVQPGGEGTPEIADFAPAELGCSLKTSAGSAKRLMADALDLRHRLPRTWAAARAGQAPTYQARHIAQATRHLTVGQARQVDQRVAAALGTVSWGRLQDLVDGLVYEADPEGADAAAELAARERFVRWGRVTEHGMRLIIAKIAAGDGAWGEAMIARLAEILQRDGDLDCVDIRRSKALGILITQPAEALRLLNSHQHDDDDPAQSPEPDEGSRIGTSSIGPLSPARRPMKRPMQLRTDQPTLRWPVDRLKAPMLLRVRRRGVGRCGSGRRRSIRPRRGRGPSSMSTCRRRRCGPGPGWPGSKTSGPCCCPGSGRCSAPGARSS